MQAHLLQTLLRVSVLLLFLCIVSCFSEDVGEGVNTVDTTAPTVNPDAPADGASAARVEGNIEVMFSEDIDSETLTANSFSVAPTADFGTPVPGTRAVSGAQAIFNPEAALDYSTTYQADVDATVADLAGNLLASPFSWTFTTEAAPQAPFEVPLAVGNAWHFQGEYTNTVWTASGYSQSSFDGWHILFVESSLVHAGRDGWLVRHFRLDQTATAEPGLTADLFYLGGDVAGLYRSWPDGGWNNVLLFTQTHFSDSAFLLAGGPAHGDGSDLGTSSISVPAGAFETLSFTHSYTETGPNAPADIFETRREYYGDGFGLVKATRNYGFDDNNPRGIDLTAVGCVELLDAMNGSSLPLLTAEQEPNDGYGADESQPLAPWAIVSDSVHIDDERVVVIDAEVGCQSRSAYIRTSTA